MPKIEVNEEIFYTLAERRWDISDLRSREEFEEALVCAKAELDSEISPPGSSPADRTLKIELNDTNRPDL